MKPVLVALTLTVSCASAPSPSPAPPIKQSTWTAPTPHPSACRLAHVDGAHPDKAAIVAAMASISARVRDCFDRGRQLGEADVAIDVSANGALESVRVDGELAGTDEARCIENATRDAQLPPFSDAYSICYPYIFR
jgi:hypothetical protein